MNANAPAIADRPSIAIVGAGAIGAYYGGRLAQHGHDVHFLLRSDYEHVRRHGWKIRSCAGDFEIPAERLKVYRDPAEMPAVDLVIVTLKTTANDQLERLVRPLVKDSTVLLTLQNGLGNEEVLATHFGGERVLGGLAFICTNRLEPGLVSHTAHGLIRLGEHTQHRRDRSEAIARMFNEAGVPCQVLDDLRQGRWEKLVWNVPFNGLGAALDLTTDRLINNPRGVKLVSQLMAEVIATAQAIGLPLPPKMIAEQIEKTREMAAYVTSMQLDRREGRPLEIDAILTRPIAIAEEAGVEVPRMRMVQEMLSIVDAGLRG